MVTLRRPGRAAGIFTIGSSVIILVLSTFALTGGIFVSGAHAAAPIGVPRAAAPQSSSLVISQVYGGGGNSGAVWHNDFIELFNPTGSPVSVNGWSVQYASATGSSWQATALTGIVQPG